MNACGVIKEGISTSMDALENCTKYHLAHASSRTDEWPKHKNNFEQASGCVCLAGNVDGALLLIDVHMTHANDARTEHTPSWKLGEVLQAAKGLHSIAGIDAIVVCGSIADDPMMIGQGWEIKFMGSMCQVIRSRKQTVAQLVQADAVLDTAVEHWAKATQNNRAKQTGRTNKNHTFAEREDNSETRRNGAKQ